MAALTITPTTGGSGTGAVTPEVQVNVPVTLAFTGLTASTKYIVLINDPVGGHSGIPVPAQYQSDVNGNLNITTVIASCAGTGAISVYNTTPTTTVTSTQSVVAAP